MAEMHAHVKTSAENKPGVYRMVAADGEVVYVGKAKQVRTRLLSYFRAAYPDEKGARILREAHTIEWDYVPSEFAALLGELRLIKRFRPRHNVAMKRDGRNLCFIKLTGGVAPKLAVVRGPGTDDNALYYGPFLGAVRVADSLRELADVLGLRDCSLDKRMHYSDQRERRDVSGSSSRSASAPASPRARRASTWTASGWRARSSTAPTTARSRRSAARWS